MKKYTIEEIRKWWNAQDGFLQVLDIIPSEASIDRANGYTSNTHVEDENKFIGSLSDTIEHDENYADRLANEGPDPEKDSIY